jgi:hypothetical protein
MIRFVSIKNIFGSAMVAVSTVHLITVLLEEQLIDHLNLQIIGGSTINKIVEDSSLK